MSGTVCGCSGSKKSSCVLTTFDACRMLLQVIAARLEKWVSEVHLVNTTDIIE